MNGLKMLIALFIIVVALCLAIPAIAAPPKNIYQTAADIGSFSTLVEAAKATHLDNTLITGGPYTVLAPTDGAFNKLPAGTLNSLLKDRPQLTALLKNHIISGRYNADDMAKRGVVNTLDGKQLMVTKANDGTITIGGAKVLNPGIVAGNGDIIAIDGVLVPK
jgi:uncharacterized surface protein with fasciclin (FAS1) repeats